MNIAIYCIAEQKAYAACASYNNPISLKRLVTNRESSTVNPMRQELPRKNATNIRSRLGLLLSRGNHVRKSLEPHSRQLPPQNDGCLTSMCSMKFSATCLSPPKGK